MTPTETRSWGIGAVASALLAGSACAAPATIVRRSNRVAEAQELRQELARHFDDIGRCYTSELPFHGELQGAIVLHLVVDPSGQVRDPYISKSTLLNASVEHCILELASAWTVPVPPRQPMALATRFVMQPGD